MTKRVRNVTKATAVGAGVGAIATPAIVWVAGIIEARYHVPADVTMPLLGSAAALFMRWAATLAPDC